MRLWSLHPSMLDTKALIAVWREGLLAQAVLLGKTKGYKNHPQLKRFKTNPAYLGYYLSEIHSEAARRGYKFNYTLIKFSTTPQTMIVTTEQVKYEKEHLESKVWLRSPKELLRLKVTNVHPIFHVVDGPVESWEITK